jgi:hypothetical protein
VIDEISEKLEKSLVTPSIVPRRKSLYFDCHSGLAPESSVFNLDSRFRGNDEPTNFSKEVLTHYTKNVLGPHHPKS